MTNRNSEPCDHAILRKDEMSAAAFTCHHCGKQFFGYPPVAGIEFAYWQLVAVCLLPLAIFALIGYAVYRACHPAA